MLMLAHEFEKYKHKIQYPCIVQEKYDGVRATFHRYDGFMSRNDKPINLPDTTARLKKDWKHVEMTIDGELIVKDKRFNEGCGLIRRSVNFLDESNVIFVAFDVMPSVCSKATYNQRRMMLLSLPLSDVVIIAPSLIVDTSDTGDIIFNHMVEEGAEGIMYRNINSIYKRSRSFDLIKRKRWHTARCKIIGHEYGQGKYAGLMGALVVQATFGTKVVTFNVGTGFSDYERAHPPARGVCIDVKFQELSKNNIPRFPVYTGVSI